MIYLYDQLNLNPFAPRKTDKEFLLTTFINIQTER